MSFTVRQSTIQRLLAALILLSLLASCSPSTPVATPTATTRSLPTPEWFKTSVPHTDDTAEEFLTAWKAGDYERMYALLSQASQAAIPQDKFIQRYTDVANEAALKELNYSILSNQVNGQEATVQFDVTLTSAIIGDIKRSNTLKMVVDNGGWRVVWSDDAILPELAGGNYLKMDGETPVRAAIYDRSGNPLAAQAQAAAIGVWPDYVSLQDDENLISLLSTISGLRYDYLSDRIEQADFGAYLPVVEVPVTEENQRRLDSIRSWSSAVVSEYSRRFYFGGGIGTHVVGYVSAIQQEEAGQFRRRGYRPDERVGRKGLEQWGEDVLMGQRGGSLYVFSPDGSPISELGAAAGTPGQDIYTTLDRDFQEQVQAAISGFTGAVIVLERNTGRVLAMASSPNFDPNAYEFESYNSVTQLSEIVNNPGIPQFNRATQGQYPLGSVFKIMTMAAALESGRFTAQSEYDCQYTFTELSGVTLEDWTLEHFREDGETLPSGVLTLPQGLIKSCNPWFYHIGNDLYSAGLTDAVAKMARGFGLGSKTGIEGVDEEAGNIPEPASQLDATNQAIGQGDTQVTPMQVARFIAAIGNGGTLYRPQIIEKIAPPSGDPTRVFTPEAQGTLPITKENLALIQEAMKGVVASKKPVGTAVRPMDGLDIPVAGKTGTAQAPAGDSHAWFAGYTFAEYPNKPDIAVVVIAENAGEGSEVAAPIFRRVIELWFHGKPMRLYKWESAIGVTRSPTPEGGLETSVPTNRPGSINP